MKEKRKASGVNIPEAQRTTIAVKLRLDVDVAEDLDALAERWGMNRSQCVSRLLAMKKHEPFIEEGRRRMQRLEEELEQSGALARGNCTACNGAGRLGDGDGHYRDCSICDGTGNRERVAAQHKRPAEDT